MGDSVYELSRLTVDGLCARLNDPDPGAREKALICLGLRYEKPGVAVNGYGLKNAPEPELPIPTSLVARVNGIATNDPCLKVRAAALDALGRMMFRIDTSTLISRHLSDTNVFIKLKAAAVLIGVYEDSHREPVPELVPALTACVDPNGDPEIVWQAAWYLGRLGPQAKAAVPELEKAKKHHSKKVRHYVSEALSRIRGRGT
jgi:HEAT repeat protein